MERQGSFRGLSRVYMGFCLPYAANGTNAKIQRSANS